MNDQATAEFDTVRANSDPQVNQKIDSAIEERIRFYASQPREAISKRIEELEQEWDIERFLETNAAGIALAGVVLGLVRKKWLLVSATVLAFMLQHALKGWSPPSHCCENSASVPGARSIGKSTRSRFCGGIFNPCRTTP